LKHNVSSKTPYLTVKQISAVQRIFVPFVLSILFVLSAIHVILILESAPKDSVLILTTLTVLSLKTALMTISARPRAVLRILCAEPIFAHVVHHLPWQMTMNV
jgi:hypothetical protein